ncbi:exopolysaccharide biosynthesis polyprenyl glycosylphosphotransferase [Fodinicurvata halophila]|uniref:Exopolysaccharide biosynthesis polyprenyl glycosylphosphotransferase n=1 Tax=Fodinicurvata halophila TaxID=1419723 RepID=A0ABV8UH27_9PROT
MQTPFSGRQEVIKRVEDYLIATLALLLASPLMGLVAIAIKLGSGGPVLFRQRRLGLHGKPFVILKFRTMARETCDTGEEGTRPDDPRITPVGRLLRRASLDELPQFLNVLRGEMSVVGPRAHVPGMQIDDRTYLETVEAYALRHRVKPGITGWAQVNGMRGGIRTRQRARRGVRLDLQYIDNWSLWLDLRILLRTLFGGLTGRNVF